MQPKPRHLSADYAAQFTDASIVAAYSNRPPYPAEVFETLALLSKGGRVLELGSGTGDLTLGLAPRVAGIDAVEPSARMLEHAEQRAAGVASNIRWIASSAEDFEWTARYALVVAAESIHWMDWPQLFPRIARSLQQGGMLAIVTERKISEPPWQLDAWRIVIEHSTNKDYRRYDVIEELSQRHLFREVGRRRCVQPGFTQSLDAYIESFHSRNGLSRERMSVESAASFDAALRQLLLAHAPSGIVSGSVETTVVWGEPSDS